MKTLIRESLIPLIAVAAAILIGGLIVLAIGDSPVKVYLLLISSAFGLFDALGNFTFDNWGYTLFQTTPLIFTGLAVAVAFKCGLLNIGAEGQLYVGAFAAAWVGITFANFPGFVLIPMAIIAVGIRTNPGNFAKVIPTHAAANAPTYNCPSAPMFSNPHLNANATAKPVKISGVA